MIQQLRREPVMLISTLAPFAITILVSFGLHLTPTQVAAVGTISTAVTALAAAALVTPVNIVGIGAAISTILVAAGAFGLHLTGAQISVYIGIITSVLGYLMREKVTPVTGTRPK